MRSITSSASWWTLARSCSSSGSTSTRKSSFNASNRVRPINAHWKLTDEDWRNREKWELYEEAVNEMLLKTSTISAPWTVVEGNSKVYARVKILKTLVDKLSLELNVNPSSKKLLRGSHDSSGKNKEKEGKTK